MRGTSRGSGRQRLAEGGGEQARRSSPRDRLALPITVLTRLRAFSPNIAKFGHALRDFRNYVHPAEQLAHGFSPDAHTARISFHVVQAAAEDLVRFCEEP